MKPLAGLLLALLLLAACERSPVGPVAPPPNPKDLPLTFVQTTPDATVRLWLSHEISLHQGLWFRLYPEEITRLKGFAETARDDRQRQLAKGVKAPPYLRLEAWDVTVATPHLIGVRETAWERTLGPILQPSSSGLLWDPVNGEDVPHEALLRPGADTGRLDAVLCRAVKAAIAQRYRRPPSPDLECPHWSDSDFVLVRSTEPGKIGGLLFMFEPRALGEDTPEGVEALVPLADFKSELGYAYAAQFSGAPAGP